MKINAISQNDAISKYINNVSNSCREPCQGGYFDSVELSEGVRSLPRF